MDGVYYDYKGNLLAIVQEEKKNPNNSLTKDAENMLEIMEHTANSRDCGWQYIYWIAVAVYHLILNIQVTKFGLKRRIEELEQRG